MYMRFLGSHQGHVAANPNFEVDAMDVDVTETDDSSNDMAGGQGNDSGGEETVDEDEDEVDESEGEDEGDSDEEHTGFDDL